MRQLTAALLMAVALLLAPAPGHAGGRGRGGWHGGGWHGGGWHGGGWRGGVFIGGGPWWWGGPYPYYPYGYPYPYAYPAYPPIVVEPGPQAYVEQPQPAGGYWYYCPSARAYYPTVPECSEAWIKVPPSPR